VIRFHNMAVHTNLATVLEAICAACVANPLPPGERAG
jgi:very-short-patch-repair endonuclease